MRILITFILTLTAAASTVPELTALQVDEGPELDGIFDDPCWAEADWFEGFTQRDPDHGEPSTELTLFAVCYTTDTLYLAFDCRESEPEGIISHLTRRDSGIGLDDNVDFYLSPTGEGRLLYYFGTNPHGIKADILYTHRADYANMEWDAHWDVATAITEQGWKAEFAIPFTNFQFEESVGGDWLFNAGRVIRRIHEETYLSPVAYNANMFYTEYAARLKGIEGVESGLGIEIVPYGKVDYRNYPGLSEEDRDQWNPIGGLVLDLDIGRNLTLAATTFPDFAEIDLDPDQYQIGRGQIFIRETRPFFLENSNFFDTAGFMFFYPRRIGKRLFDDEGIYHDSDIVAGGRLTGTLGPVGIGSFYAHTDEALSEPESDWGIGRVTVDLGRGSYVGAIGTSRFAREITYTEYGSGGATVLTDPAYDYASYAVDFDAYFGDEGRWNTWGMFAGTYDSRFGENDLERQFGMHGGIAFRTDQLDTYIEYTDTAENFDINETGFTGLTNLRMFNWYGRYRIPFGGETFLRNLWIQAWADVWRERDWSSDLEEYHLEISSMTNGGWIVGVEGMYGTDHFFDPEDPTEFIAGSLYCFTDPSAVFKVDFWGMYGKTRDYSITGAEGNILIASAGFILRPFSSLLLNGSLDYYDWSFFEGELDYWAGMPRTTTSQSGRGR